MKISWIPVDASGMSALQATPEIYDGAPPIPALLVDGAPTALSGDRLGVASALAFARYSSGDLVLPRPVSPAVAQAIQAFHPDTWILVSPVKFEPAPLPTGTARLILADGDTVGVRNAWGKSREILLDVRRSDRFAGQLASMDQLVLCSNAWLHAGSDDVQDVDHYLGLLAVAVLSPESLQVDEIVLPVGVDLRTPRAESLIALMAAARLGLGGASSDPAGS